MTGRVVVAVLACCALAGCSRAHETSPAEIGTPVSADQALVLAQLLLADKQHDGARFTARLRIDGHPVRATGRVDFDHGRGTAELAPVNGDLGPPRRYFWTRKEVLAQSEPGSARFQRQAPDAAHDPVHALIAFVNLLAAKTIDNTAAIQSQDARYVRPTTIGGQPADEYVYGPTGATTFWVGSDGLLRRVRTRRVPGGLTVDLLSHGPEKIVLPARAGTE